MAVKAQWTSNPAATANQRVYDSGSVKYDTTLTYDGMVAGQSLITTKVPTNWGADNPISGSASVWVVNPLATVTDPYDNSSNSYDGGGTSSALDNYDDVVAGQSTITTKIATNWSVVTP